MQTNETPFNDQSVNMTGCCARFNPAGWEGQILHFENKPFLRAETWSVAHVPLNMGKVFTRVLAKTAAAHAIDPEHGLVMSRDLSAFGGEHLFAVTGPVEHEEMVTVSGTYLTKVFEGPFSQIPQWEAALKDAARTRGHRPKAVWFYYTTCPKCAEVYGRNPVVGLVELGDAA
jgi:hypothetical protein